MLRIDKYEIIEEIDRGGMGVIYKAFHPHLKKYVAIKEIRSEIASEPDLQTRFEREAEILAQLPAHPHLVMVRDALMWNGRLYLVMDFIDGIDLSRVIQQGAIDIPRGIKWLEQIISGLGAIHRRGIIHRDLKPANILIDREDVAYISDFGIAQAAGYNTNSGLMATAKYAAPELLDSKLSRGGIESQIDIYAAGMLAYEMFLGPDRFRYVFSGIYKVPSGETTERWLAWHTDLTRSAPDLHEVYSQFPRSLATVIQRMMSKDVTERYRDAEEVRRHLKECRIMSQEPSHLMKTESDDVTVRLDKQRSVSRDPLQTSVIKPPIRQGQVTKGRRRPLGSLPRWVLPAAAAIALLFILVVLPMLLHDQPGFTLILKGTPANSQVYVDDVLRGIPGLENAGANLSSVIRVHGLKANIRHAVRVNCDGGNATLYLDGGSSVEDVTAQDGEVVRLLAKNCEPPRIIPPEAEAEIDYNGKMRLVKAGAFLMGDDQGQPNEKPAHEVNLNYDYYIDKFEVTNQQFKDFCSTKGRRFPSEPFWDTSYASNNPTSPALGVTWDDAKSYCEDWGKSLPTEAEWEKAASWDPKATDATKSWKRRWPWGNDFGQGRANFNTQHPVPVGRFADGASAYGVYEMAGNAFEWVQDTYNPYPNSQVSDPQFGTSNRVVRGGSFKSDSADYLRTTFRVYRQPLFSAQELSRRAWLIGFRCAIKRDNPRLQEHLKTASQIK